MSLNQCSICLDDIANIEFTETSCGHIFHKDCLESWLNQYRAQNIDVYLCPLCRSDITEDYPIIYYWNETSKIKMIRNKDIEVRYYQNSQIKYKIYINSIGEVNSGIFFDKDGINKIQLNELNRLNDINNIRNNDHANIII